MVSMDCMLLLPQDHTVPCPMRSTLRTLHSGPISHVRCCLSAADPYTAVAMSAVGSSVKDYVATLRKLLAFSLSHSSRPVFEPATAAASTDMPAASPVASPMPSPAPAPAPAAVPLLSVADEDPMASLQVVTTALHEPLRTALTDACDCAAVWRGVL